MKAKIELSDYVSTLEPTSIGLSQDFMVNVCPRASTELQTCFESLVNDKMANVKELCFAKINQIFKNGASDLEVYLENELFPKYIDGKISERLEICREKQADMTSPYSESFMKSFENSDFYEKCSDKVQGKNLLWFHSKITI